MFNKVFWRFQGFCRIWLCSFWSWNWVNTSRTRRLGNRLIQNNSMLRLRSRKSIVRINERKWHLKVKDYFRNQQSTTTDLKQRRSRVAKYVKFGKRTGYSLWLVAIILFFSLFFSDFDGPLVGLLLACLIAGCVILLPSIVLSYAVRAAEREERDFS